MSEQVVFSSRAVVYYYDAGSKQWAPSPVTGFTRLDIYVHSGTGAVRVIGRGFEDPSKVVVNSSITKESAYQKARDTFHQWTDQRGAYGLNFSTKEEADAFSVAFENSKPSNGSAPAKPAPAPPPAANRSAPPAAAPKAAPPAPAAKGAPPPPAPPKAPPKPPPGPPAASSRPPADPGRGALLGSIQGFSKGKLKKAETNDRSGLIAEGGKSGGAGNNPLTRNNSSSDTTGSKKAAAAGGGSGGGGGGIDMMAEIKQKQNTLRSGNNKPAAPAPPPAHTPAAPPPVPAKAAPPRPPPAAMPNTPSKQGLIAGSHSNSSGNLRAGEPLPEHLQQLKEEILAEFRAELAQFKQEILEQLSQRY